MNKMKELFIFIAGLGIGSAITYKVLKDRYDEDVEFVRNFWKNKSESKEVEEQPLENKKMGIVEYAALIKENEYSDEEKKSNQDEKEDEDEINDKPYIIDVDEFGIFDDYDSISLTYYSDGYVTDDGDNLMSNDEVEEAIGWMNLTHMGEEVQDALYIRNDIRKVDYEVLQVLDNYKEE